MKVRQSDLKTFGECGRRYYYSRILGLGGDKSGSLTVMGTVWHFAVDVYENYDYDLDLAKRTFVHYWENPKALGERIDFWHRSTTHEGLRKRGLSMLERYHELAPWRQGRRLGSEIHFEVPIGNHVLEGTIDKLWARPGKKRLEIVDFKTGAAVPEKLRHNIQFTAYCYATERPEFWQYVPGHEDGFQEFAGWQRGGWWYHARNNKMFNAGNREAADYKKLALAVEEMDNAVQANVFPLDIKGESCGYCAFAEGTCGSEMKDPR